MKTMPAIGVQVRFCGNTSIGACVGTVTKQWHGYVMQNAHGDYSVPDTVTVEVSEKPAQWPYPDQSKFIANLEDIEPI